MITTLRNHCFNFDVFVFEMIKQETYKTIWWWWNYIVIHITRDSKLERSFSVLILLTQSQVINENTTFHFHLELWNEFFMLKATKEVHILWNVRFSMHLACENYWSRFSTHFSTTNWCTVWKRDASETRLCFTYCLFR